MPSERAQPHSRKHAAAAVAATGGQHLARHPTDPRPSAGTLTEARSQERTHRNAQSQERTLAHIRSHHHHRCQRPVVAKPAVRPPRCLGGRSQWHAVARSAGVTRHREGAEPAALSPPPPEGPHPPGPTSSRRCCAGSRRCPRAGVLWTTSHESALQSLPTSATQSLRRWLPRSVGRLSPPARPSWRSKATASTFHHRSVRFQSLAIHVTRQAPSPALPWRQPQQQWQKRHQMQQRGRAR